MYFLRLDASKAELYGERKKEWMEDTPLQSQSWIMGSTFRDLLLFGIFQLIT